MKETMTVHEALCELKTLRKRVEDGIQEAVPIQVKESGATTINGKPVQDFIETAKAQHQSVVDLINRQDAIKRAVNQYNAQKIVTVAGKNFSIAEAIYEKSYGIPMKRYLLSRYQQMLKSAMDSVADKNGDKLNLRAENAMTSLFGTKEKSEPEKYLKALQEYKEQHMCVLVDPLDLAKVVKKMEEEITGFEAKVDAAIQIANATTEIKIEY